MEQEIRATPGQAANTRGAYPLTTTQSPASPRLSLQPVSPARRLHSADVTRVDAEGRFKMFPPSRTERGRGGQPLANEVDPFGYPAPSRATREGRREGR
jgi:hypothetical protein